MKSIEQVFGGEKDFRKSILSLEDELRKHEQLDLPVKHFFAPGLYVREIFMPAGSVVTGKIHKHAHFNVILAGKVTVSTEFGVEEYEAPCRFVSEPGTKRAVYVHEDCIWQTFHPTDKTDLAEIEEDVIAPSYDLLPNKSKKYAISEYDLIGG